MSLKRANYLCGHQSCDNKKCSVRLSRELTRAACHVLERGFRDAKRKERVPTHVTAAGEDIRDLPDLAALDLPLIEDSDTKISLVSEKLDEIEEHVGNDDIKKIKVKREKKTSLQRVEQKSIPRSNYGPGSNYLKFSGIDVKQPSGGVKTSNYDTRRSVVEMRMAGSSKLTNVFGESSSSNASKHSTARTDMFKNKSTSKPIKFGNPFRNQMEEPIIIESHRRSSSARSNSKSKKFSDPDDIITDSMDEMQVLFRFNSERLTKPKLKVQNMLAVVDDEYSLLKGEKSMATVEAQNKFPSVWDASDSDDSDVPFLERSWQLQPLPENSRLAYPDMNTKNSQETPNDEDTCVSRNLNKALNAPKRMSVSFSAKTSPEQEFRSSFGRNTSEFSTRHPSKIKPPTRPQTANIAADLMKLKPRTADVSNTKVVNSRVASRLSTSFKSAANSTTRVLKSQTSSVTSRTADLSTSKVLNGRTASKLSTKSKGAADSNVTLVKNRTLSTTPRSAGASTTRGGQIRTPVASSKLSATSTTSAVKRQVPSTTSRTAADSSTKLIKSRQASTVSTKSAAVSATKVVKSRASSAASNSSSERKGIHDRTESRTPTKLQTTADSNTKLIKSRQASTMSTKSKSAAVPTTKVFKSRPTSATSNSSSERKAINGRTESRASTISKITADSNTKLIKSRQASTMSTKSKSAAVPTTKVVKSRPTSATSNSSSERKAINGRTESRASTTSKITADSNTKLIKSRQASTMSTKSKSAAVPTTKVFKSRPTSATSNSSSERKAINGRTESKTLSKSKLVSDSTNKIPLARVTTPANKSKIPVPVPAGPRPMSARPMANVAAKVDCRRPMTAVVAKLSPNVKLVEDRSRPQTSGTEEGRSKTSVKSTLVRPSSELKRKPITLRLGSKTQPIEGESIRFPPGKVSATRISRTSDENVSSPTMKARPSVPRSALTSTSCSGWSTGTNSSSSISKEPVSTLVSRETNGHGQSIKPASKIPLPVNPVDRKRFMKKDDKVSAGTSLAPDSSSNTTLTQPANTSIFHICEEMLNEEKLTPSAKAALLRMNKEMIKTGKVKPIREGRPSTAPQGSQSKLTKENIDWDEEIEEVLIPAQTSKVSVKKRISLFDKVHDSSSVSSRGTVVQKDEPTDDDYVNLLELDSTIPCVGSRKMKNSFTESMMQFIREDALKVARELDVSVEDGNAQESVKETEKNDSLG